MSRNRSPELLNQQQLEKLSQDPKNRVYTYVHDAPSVRFTTEQQKRYVTQIRQRYLALREQQPEAPDRRLRDELRADAAIASFADNNSRIFETLTARESTPDHINHLRYMLYLREQQERGFLTETEAQNMIQDYLVTAFKTNLTPREYEAQLKAGASGSAPK